MKTLWISLLFLLLSVQAEEKKHSVSEIKNKTLGQVKKDSQNETTQALKQENSLKAKASKENNSKKEEPLLKKTKSKKFHVGEDLQFEIQSLKDNSSQNESQLKETSTFPFDMKAFEKIISNLKKEAFNSEKYKKKVHALETAFYNKATFDSLELLAELFDKKHDNTNHIKVLEMTVSNYPENPKGHFLLGMGYKHLYLKEMTKDNFKTKESAIESLSQAIKLDRKYKEAYEQLLPLLMKQELSKAGHNHFSLSLIKDMIRYLNDPNNYSLLCEAYYETNFIRQARKACLKATEEDPKQPKNHLYLAFVQENKKDINKKVEETAVKFSDSYPVQFQAGLFFVKENPSLAIEYLGKATEIQPHSHPAHIQLAWLLFNSDRVKKSYKHFFQSCIYSNGKSMKDFQTATAQLRLKKKISVTTKTFSIERKWRKGISECFNQLKENSKKNKKLNQYNQRV